MDPVDDSVTVEYWDDNVHRIVFNKIDRNRYQKLWQEGKLKFQREGRERPSHYPDPELL
ncbi:MAG TPA: hypothetical protein VGE31_00435 [Candidatus Paceibacterota bacterium]